MHWISLCLQGIWQSGVVIACSLLKEAVGLLFGTTCPALIQTLFCNLPLKKEYQVFLEISVTTCSTFVWFQRKTFISRYLPDRNNVRSVITELNIACLLSVQILWRNVGYRLCSVRNVFFKSCFDQMNYLTKSKDAMVVNYWEPEASAASWLYTECITIMDNARSKSFCLCYWLTALAIFLVL